AKIGRPPILRVRHQGMEVLDHGIEVEAFEFPSVVERLPHRIGQAGMLVENLKVQLVRPPVTVRACAASARKRALAVAWHVVLLFVLCFSASPTWAPAAVFKLGLSAMGDSLAGRMIRVVLNW